MCKEPECQKAWTELFLSEKVNWNVVVRLCVSGVQFAACFSSWFGLRSSVAEAEVRDSVHQDPSSGGLSVSVPWSSGHAELEGRPCRTTVGAAAAVGPKHTAGSGHQVGVPASLGFGIKISFHLGQVASSISK